MANKIQIRRGNQANLPTLDEGEFGFSKDTERLYIGNPLGSGNILMSIGPGGFDLGNGADGYVTFFTGPNRIAGDNDFFWDREANRLGIRTDTPTHTLTVDGYITPATDNLHALGTPTQRWEALWVGPDSIHIHSNESETGTSFDWRITIDQTTENEGTLLIMQGEEQFISIDPVSSEITFNSLEVGAGNVIKLPETNAPLNETGFGKVYISLSDGDIHYINSSGVDYNLSAGVTSTVQEHYNQHSEALQTILKDLDGYALDETVSEHYTQHSDAIQTIIGSLDGYSSDTGLAQTVEEHKIQTGEIIQTILKDLDGYGSASELAGLVNTELEHYVQHSDVFATIRKELDGYASDATVSEHYTQHSDAIQTIIGSLDGYSSDTGLAQTVEEHKVQVGEALQSILKDLDGYGSASELAGLVNTELEHYVQHSDVFATIRKELDGYNQTISEHYTQHSDAIDTIRKDLDGYALQSDLLGLNQTVEEHYTQHSEALQTILSELDGYATSIGGGFASVQTVDEHYTQHSNALQTIISSLDGYSADTGLATTVEEHKIQTGEIIQTILKDLDGYALQSSLDTTNTNLSGLNQTVEEHKVFSNDAVKSIVESLDGYITASGGDYASVQTVSEHYSQHSDAFDTIRKDLDGYALQSSLDTTNTNLSGLNQTVEEHYSQHSEAIQTVIGSLDGYSSDTGLAQTVEEHKIQVGEIVQTILKDLDGYALQSSLDTTNTNLSGLSQTVEENKTQTGDIIQTILKDLDGYGSGTGLSEITFQENKSYWDESIHHVVEALDGYGSGGGDVSQTNGFTGADGYVAFFTGDKEIAGDNDLYWDRKNNRLGLGTTSPQNKLDVEGTVAIGATYSGTSTAPSNGLIVQGNVGIGNSSPAAVNLHLGSSYASLYMGGNNSNGFHITKEASDNSLNIWSGVFGAGTRRFMIDSSGNIGVGVDPVNKLDVEGAVAIGASYSGTSTAPSNGLIVQGNVGIGTTSPQNKLDVEGAVAIGASYSGTSSAPTNGLIVEGQVGIGDTTIPSYASLHIQRGDDPVLVLEDQGNFVAFLAAEGTAYDFIFGTEANFNWKTSVSFATGPVASGSSVMYLTSGGNLGIGTTSPQNKLDVEGAVAIGATYSGTSTAPSNGLIVEGNVGIGTTSISEKLEVAPDTDVSAEIGRAHVGYMGWDDYAGFSHIDSNTTTGYSLLQASDGTTFLNAASGQSIAFRINNSDVGKFDSSGNFGIGISSPAAKLNVLSGIQLDPPSNSSQSFLQFITDTDGNALGQSTNKGWQIVARGESYATSSQREDLIYAYWNGSSWADRFYFDHLGNFGIGTTDPQNKLDVEGAVAIGATYSGTSTAPLNGLVVEGNVGIGTDSPDQTLHVYKGNAGTVDSWGNAILTVENSTHGYIQILTPDANERGIFFGEASNNIAGGIIYNSASTTDGFQFRVNSNNIAMVIDSLQRVGIGVTSPDGPLHVYGSYPVLTVERSHTGTDDVYSGTILKITTSGDMVDGFGTGLLYQIEDDAAVTNNIARIAAYRDGADNSGALSFSTYDSGSLLERMTIRSGGNVGIGTSSPDSASTLHIHNQDSSGHARLHMSSDAGPGEINGAIAWYSGVGSAAYAGIAGVNTSSGAGLLYFSTDNGITHYTRMVIDEAGNVAIGDNNFDPHEKLTINGIISLQEQDNYDRTHDGYGSIWAKSDGKVYYTNDSGTDYDLTSAGGGGGDVSQTNGFTGADGYVAFFTGDGEIAGDNDFFYNRSIGRLTVAGGSPQSGVFIAQNESKIGGSTQPWSTTTMSVRDSSDQNLGVGGGIIFEGKYNSSGWYSAYGGIRGSKMSSVDGEYGGYLDLWGRNYATSGGIRLSGTAPTDVYNFSPDMIINASGNVGIGTDSPSEKLDVIGDVYIGNNSDASGIYLQHQYTSGNTAHRMFMQEDSNSLYGFSLIYAGSANPTFNGTGFTLAGNEFYIQRHSGTNTGVTAMSIARADGEVYFEGKVGIGTTTPSANLHIKSTGDAGIWLEADTDNSNEDDNPYIRMTQDGGIFTSTIGLVGSTATDPADGTSLTGVGSNSLLIRSPGRIHFVNDTTLGFIISDGGTLFMPATQSTPSDSSNFGKLYIKSDGRLYYKQEGQTEVDLAHYGVTETTFQENKSYWDESIHHIVGSLDGYGGGGGDVSQTSGFTGADGYVAFFTGDGEIAGDNDLFYNRENGYFGIGTDNPTVKLTVHGDIRSTDSTAGFQITSPLDIPRYGLKYGSAGNTGDANVIMLTNREVDGAVAIATDNGTGGGTGETERIRISAGGDTLVGIGTSSPVETLTVNGFISLQEQDNYDRTHDGYGSIWAKSDGKLYFTNDAGTDYDLTSAGGGGGDVTKVGTPVDNEIGVWTGDGTIEGDSTFTYSGNYLEIDATGNPGFSIISSTADSISFIKLENDVQAYQIRCDGANSDSFLIRNNTAATYPFAITTGGNVGIGTIAPQNKLDVEGAAAIGATYSGTSTAPTNGLIVEGSVGIGTSSVTQKLEVFPDSDNSGVIGRAHIGSISFSNYAGFAHFDNANGTNYALIQGQSGDTKINAASGQTINFRINNSTRAGIDSSENFFINTNLSVGGNIINDDLSETFQVIRQALDGYSGGGGLDETTFQENKTYWNNAIDTITKELDGYGSGAQSAPKYDITASKTSTYTASFDEIVRCDPSGGGFTVDLPAASGGTGQTIIIKNTTSSTNTITIDGNGAETIDGQTTVSMSEGYKSLTLVSYGSEWGII